MPAARKADRRSSTRGWRFTQAGHLAEIFLPGEIQAATPEGSPPTCLGRRPGSSNIEEMDFLQVSSRREAIHAREHGRCFYCLRRFLTRGRVLDHVIPQARGGSSSYRNLDSCGVECNAQKGGGGAEDFLCTLYRLRRLTSAELEAGLCALDALAAGELRPILAAPAMVIRNPKNPKKTKACLPFLPKLASCKKGQHGPSSKIDNSDRRSRPKTRTLKTRRHATRTS